ncbi:MAG: hypothetical protein QXU44_04975 [Candidatus Caldarchaeum sp.]
MADEEKMPGMAERVKRLVDAVYELVSRPGFQELVAWVAVVVSSVVLAGVVYNVASRVVIGVAFIGDSVRVFYPDTRVQTVAEMMVVATFYILGFVGLLLYGVAFSKRFSPRASRYMLLFSTLLITLAALGLIGGYLSKS